MFLTTVQLWCIVGFSTLILLAILATMFFCFRCLISRKKNKQLYTIEEIPQVRKNSFFEIINVYRKYGKIDENLEDKLINQSYPYGNENLIDSTDLSNKFTNSLLRLNSQFDEIHSYPSTASLKTCLSSNISRSNSKCTFISCSEGSDSEDSMKKSKM